MVPVIRAPPAYTTRGVGRLKSADEEVGWNVRILTADVKLAFHFIYTRDTVTQDLIFHCIFFSLW